MMDYDLMAVVERGVFNAGHWHRTEPEKDDRKVEEGDEQITVRSKREKGTACYPLVIRL